MAQKRFNIDGGFETNSNSVIDGNLAVTSILLNGQDLASAIGSNTYTDSSIVALIDGAPVALNTLNALAAALGDDANFAASINSSLALKSSINYVDTQIAAVGVASWDMITSNTTVIPNSKNLVDTTGGAITVTLPLSPVFGQEIMLIDASGNAGTNNITIDGNGEKIQGQVEDLIISTTRAAFQVVYFNAANGWVFMEV